MLVGWLVGWLVAWPFARVLAYACVSLFVCLFGSCFLFTPPITAVTGRGEDPITSRSACLGQLVPQLLRSSKLTPSAKRDVTDVM